MNFTDEEAHDELLKWARGASAGEKLTEEQINEVGGDARPGSIPAQVGKMATAAAPTRPQADLSKPLGYAKPQDDELRGLQADAKQRRGEAALGQSVADFTERPTNMLDYAMRLGGGGVSASPAKSQAWQRHAAEGEHDIGDMKERRQSESGMAASADDSDPSSPTAQTYRSVLVRFAPDLAEQLKGANAKQMRAMAPWLEKFHAENGDTLRANATAAEKARLDAEKKAQHLKDQERDDKHRTLVHEDAQANAAATRGLTRESLEVRKGEVARKATETLDEQTVPGYTHDPKVKQAPGEVGKIRAMVASSKTISDNIDELTKLIEENGTETLPTAAKARMQSLGANILAELKGEAGFELGVLAGPDMEIMKEAIGDATSLSVGNVLGMADTTKVKLKQSRDSMIKKLANRTASGGYTPGAAAKKAGSVRVSNGKETLEIDANDVADAEKDGFKVLR